MYRKLWVKTSKNNKRFNLIINKNMEEENKELNDKVEELNDKVEELENKLEDITWELDGAYNHIEKARRFL